jgi:hypothetical protein
MLKLSRRGIAPPRSHTQGQSLVPLWKLSKRREVRSLKFVMLLCGTFFFNLPTKLLHNLSGIVYNVRPDVALIRLHKFDNFVVMLSTSSYIFLIIPITCALCCVT